MSEDYDTFSYPGDDERTNRFAPIHGASDLKYEDLEIVKQRPPPSIPDTPIRKPMLVPEAQQRPPAPLPDMGQWNLPPPPVPASLPQEQELNYEELNDIDNRIPPPPIPNQAQRRHSDTPQKKPIQPTPQLFIDINFLKAARKNLRKTDAGVPSESSKSTPEVPVKLQLATVKPLTSKKPQLQIKPFQSGLSNEKSPNLPERVNVLCLDSTQTSQDDISEDEEFDNQEEYMDATEVKSLPYQPYYYKRFPKSLENKIFNETTKDGTFVIRKSRGDNENHPYTMLVFFKSRAFRLKIRFENDEYAIGEKKNSEMTFSSVVDMVEHYKTTNLMLIGAGQVKLKEPLE